jgi:hypothetical protein
LLHVVSCRLLTGHQFRNRHGSPAHVLYYSDNPAYLLVAALPRNTTALWGQWVPKGPSGSCAKIFPAATIPPSGSIVGEQRSILQDATALREAKSRGGKKAVMGDALNGGRP